MLINGRRATKKEMSNRIKAKRRLKLRPRGLTNRQPLTLICSSLIISLITSIFRNFRNIDAHGEMTWHAGR